MTTGLPLLLLLSSPARATTWWLAEGGDEQADAEALRLALAEIWPDADLRIRVGEPLDPWDDIWVEDGELIAVQAEERWSRPVPDDPWLQVALARAWLRPVAHSLEPGAGPSGAPEPLPTAEALLSPGDRRPEEDGVQAIFGLAAGVGSRLPDRHPAVRGVASWGISTPRVEVAMHLDLETGRGEEVELEGDPVALDAARIGLLTAAIYWLGEARGADLGLGLASGVRLGLTSVPIYTEVQGLQAGPGFALVAAARRAGEGAVQPVGRLSLSWDPPGAHARDLQTAYGSARPALEPLGLFLDVGFQVAR